MYAGGVMVMHPSIIKVNNQGASSNEMLPEHWSCRDICGMYEGEACVWDHSQMKLTVHNEQVRAFD